MRSNKPDFKVGDIVCSHQGRKLYFVTLKPYKIITSPKYRWWSRKTEEKWVMWVSKAPWTILENVVKYSKLENCDKFMLVKRKRDSNLWVQ